MPVFGGVGVNAGLTPFGTNRIVLPAGGVQLLPAGPLIVRTGKYTSTQQLDPTTGLWQRIGGGNLGSSVEYIWSDGVNYRLANQSGCVVGAVMTNVGSGYTSAPTVTASPSTATFKTIVGGAVSGTVTIANGGSNYTYPPTVLFSAPPPGGVPATGYCALTTGAVSSVTVVDQGAGYTSPPTISFVNDPRENYSWNTFGFGAAATAALTGSGEITAILVLDHGAGGLTAVPTLVFSGGGGSSAAGTALMNWGVTAYTVTTAGTGFTAPIIVGIDNSPIPATIGNPGIYQNLVSTRSCWIQGAVSGGDLTATGQVVYDRGVFTGVANLGVIEPGTLITATGLVAATMGGGNDTSFVMQQ